MRAAVAPHAWIAVPLDGYRQAPRWLLLYVAVLAPVLPFIAFDLWFPSAACAGLGIATKGVFGGTMDYQVFAWVVFLVALYIAKLRLKDAGFLWSQVPLALAVTALSWIAMQVASLLGEAAEVPAAPHPGHWESYVNLQTQVLGVGPLEETIFHGFLVPQVYLWLRARRSWSPTRSLIVAVFLTHSFFAATHFRSNLHMGIHGAAMIPAFLGQMGCGLVVLAIWFRTGNLMIAAGFHGLANTRVDDVVAETALYVGMILLLVFGRWSRWRTVSQQDRPQPAPEENQ